MSQKIKPNECPYCGDGGGKKLVDYTTSLDQLWCSGCEKTYEVLYERVPTKVVAEEKGNE